jgi:hypothetical protein
MLYSEIQTNFQAILNRRDLTPTQMSTFISMAIQRIQRVLRVPSMEAVAFYTMNGTNGTMPVPGDLLEVIAIAFNDSVNQQKLVRTDLQTAIRLSNIPGNPTSYYRQSGSFIVGPYPPAGSVCYVAYYQDASNLALPTDHNWMTDACPDLLIYGALCYAADYFLDERAQSFEARFNQILNDNQQMALADELSNASISPAYSEYDGYSSYSNGSY